MKVIRRVQTGSKKYVRTVNSYRIQYTSDPKEALDANMVGDVDFVLKKCKDMTGREHRVEEPYEGRKER